MIEICFKYCNYNTNLLPVAVDPLLVLPRRVALVIYFLFVFYFPTLIVLNFDFSLAACAIP